jgi:3-ketosteroid 9alpha-monooxygenase subunit A
MSVTPRPGFPFDALPTGWFQVAWSGELDAGDVKPVTCVSADLVLWRDESGEAHAHDAHCPHLGAHLGYGGRVERGCLVCPLHRWWWTPNGGGGAPSQRVPSTEVRLRRWPVTERDGQMWVWHDLARRAPQWPVPAVPEASDPAYRPPYPAATHVEEVALCPQLVAENLADMAHIRTVHGWADVPELHSLQPRGHHIAGVIEGAVAAPDGTRADVRVEVEWFGLGMSVQRLHGLPLPATQLIAVTPVGPDRSLIRLSTWVRDPQPGPRPGRLAEAITRLQVEEVLGERGDRRIWERQRYVDRPSLAREEAAAFATVRRWSRQFYPAPPRLRLAPFRN